MTRRSSQTFPKERRRRSPARRRRFPLPALLFAIMMTVLVAAATASAQAPTLRDKTGPRKGEAAMAGFKNKQKRKTPSEKQRWKEEKLSRRQMERGASKFKSPSEKAKWKEQRAARRKQQGMYSNSDKDRKRAERSVRIRTTWLEKVGGGKELSQRHPRRRRFSSPPQLSAYDLVSYSSY